MNIMPIYKTLKLLTSIIESGEFLNEFIGSKEQVDLHWQEISRIAAEQAAKPEIQGNAGHE